MVNHWDSAQHSSEYPTDAFGEIQFAGASKRHSYVGGLFVGSERLIKYLFYFIIKSVVFSKFLKGKWARQGFYYCLYSEQTDKADREDPCLYWGANLTDLS